MREKTYTNTNEQLYDDIAIWENGEGVELFKEIPLNENQSPTILDFGYGFGEYLFAASYAFPNGIIYGVDGNPICQKEVSQKIKDNGIINIKLINKKMGDLQDFQDNSLDLVLLYDILHGGDGRLKYMLFEEANRILKLGGCLSILPVHLGNWRDEQGEKKKYTLKKIIDEISEYGFQYKGICNTKGVHWEKCHTPYYIQNKNIIFDVLEKVEVMNFVKT